jgi:hypothetical protein
VFNLDPTPRSDGSKQIFVGDHINATIPARWGNERNVVAHRNQQFGNELLEIVLAKVVDVVFNLASGLRFRRFVSGLIASALRL